MIAIGCDHGGFSMKSDIIALLERMGLEYKDFGTYTEDSCDYPVFAKAVAKAVMSGECEKGILICGTGAGMALAANKVRGIRCVCCSDCFTAEYCRRHNDANVLSMGARVIGSGLAGLITEKFLTTAFEGGRHARRVGLIAQIEADERG